MPRVKLPQTEIDAVFHRLISSFDLNGRSQVDVLIYPGGGLLPIRSWPAAYYRDLCHRLVDAGYCVGIIGLDEDKALASNILSRLPGHMAFDLTGFTRSIQELVALFYMARLLITNDGGPGQFAVLSPIEVFIFFRP